MNKDIKQAYKDVLRGGSISFKDYGDSYDFTVKIWYWVWSFTNYKNTI